jgi:hypothetical protein
MSVDGFPILLAEQVKASMPCQNSLTDDQVRFAQAALRHLGPDWTLDCQESCETDVFLDLCSVLPDGRHVSFIIHAQDGAIHVLRMRDDDHIRIGSFEDIAAAMRVVVAATGLTGR